jgi:3-oxoacyl-[acyl-carrier protein] reductase
MDLGLAGKVAVVTGGSKGMGKWTALEFASEGCDVAVVARGQEALDKVAAQIEERGARALAVAIDLMKPGSDVELFARVVEHFGGCDILVNTLGGDDLEYQTLDVMSDELWQQHLEMGLLADLRCCRAAIPHMRARGGGAIVNVSATAIRKPMPALVAYCASKAGLAVASKALAHTLGPDNIRVNVVCPGIVLTEGVREKLAEFPPERWSDGPAAAALGDNPSTEDLMMAICEDIGGRGRGLIPDIARPGRPEELAAAIVFLCSARSSYTTGAMLNVDGGTDF